MALFGFLKKKKKVELPPPPEAPETRRFISDFDVIQPNEASTQERIPAEIPLPDDLGTGIEEETPEQPAETQHEEEHNEEPQELPVPELPRSEVKVFDRRANVQRETVHQRQTPLFISVDDYKRILSQAAAVKAKLSDAEHTMGTLRELKANEEKIIEKWKWQLEDIEKKLSSIERSLEK